MTTADLIVRSAAEYYNQLNADENGRFRSWEHCYSCFLRGRNQPVADHDYLSLQLAIYLASWGMYRGSSFLLQKDYRVHIPIVKEILRPEYDGLAGIACCQYRNRETQRLLGKLNSYIGEYYDSVRLAVKEECPKNKLSDTLITKVLMGTLGCVPAYDRYFIMGVKNQNVTTGLYNIQSLLKLVDFYENNKAQFEAMRKTLTVEGLPYPQMKMLDMGFWQIGFELDSKKEL